MTREPRWALNLKYNFLNLLEQADRGGTPMGSYRWIADGTKAAMRSVGEDIGDPLAGQYDYLGAITFQRSRWDDLVHGIEVNFGEGYIRDGRITFFEKDHVGSVRVAVNDQGTVTGRYDYTPFGERLATSGRLLDANNRFYFNGKEHQEIESFRFLDYGARIYDPEILRWEKPDPLAEKYPEISPYVFSNNNPVRYWDPDGRQPRPTVVGGTSLVHTYHRLMTDSEFRQLAWSWFKTGLTYTDLNDAVVLGSAVVSVFTGGNAVNIDGSTATTNDIRAAEMGVFIPAVSGSAVNKVTNAAENAVDASRGSRNARFIADPNGNMVDTHATPRGSYMQPDGQRTDILQQRTHYDKATGENVGFSHTHETYSNTIPSTGEVRTGVGTNAHRPTYMEVKNIEEEIATPLSR